MFKAFLIGQQLNSSLQNILTLMIEMENLSEENKNRLSTLIKIVDKGINHSTAAISALPDDEGHHPETFIHLNFLERFTNCLYSVFPLMKEFQTNRWVEMGIGLTLRASLLDFMTFLYLESFKPENGEVNTAGGYEKQLNDFLCDTVRNTLKYIKVNKDVGMLSQQEYQDHLNALYGKYNALFKPNQPLDISRPQDSLIGGEFATAVNLFKRIYQNTSTKIHAGVYDAYVYYSKYEHFGIVSYDLKRRGKNEEFEMMHTGLRYLFRGLLLALSYLSIQFSIEAALSGIRTLLDKIELL